jgi:hypothetical protein
MAHDSFHWVNEMATGKIRPRRPFPSRKPIHTLNLPAKATMQTLFIDSVLGISVPSTGSLMLVAVVSLIALVVFLRIKLG